LFPGNASPMQPTQVSDNVFSVLPRATGGGIKFGLDAPTARLVAVKGSVAWLQQAAKPAGEYPDGAQGAGFPVETYVNGSKDAPYVELELCGPLVNMFAGMTTTHTVRWSLHDLPSKDVSDPATRQAIEALLR